MVSMWPAWRNLHMFRTSRMCFQSVISCIVGVVQSSLG